MHRGAKVCVALAGLALSWLHAGAALADWRRAETANFVIYSQSSERALREYAVKLETYDFVLRARFGMLERDNFYKLPIFVVRDERDLRVIRPGLRAQGVYFPTSEGIFAVALRDSDDRILLHEYFHHFSYQAGGMTASPGWLTEGLAEYYMTADIRSDQVTIGSFDEGRAYTLVNEAWLPLEELLSRRPGDFRRQADMLRFYAQAWLLTHWFLSDEIRRAQLDAYLNDLAAGAQPVAAMEARTGLTLAQITRALRTYMRDRLAGVRFEFTPRPVEVTITRLPDSADDLLLLGQRLKVGVPADERAATAELVRRAAARPPDDPFALLQLGHAELHFGDPEAGEAVLMRLLEREPDNVEALQLMATRRMAQAREAPEHSTRLLNLARGFLARAYAADSYDYRTLTLIADTRVGAPGYPNDNDIATLDQAFVLAPQMDETRFRLAQALMLRERYDEAVNLLLPLANAPHGDRGADVAQRLLEDARARRQPGLIAPDLDAEGEPGQPDEGSGPQPGGEDGETPPPPA